MFPDEALPIVESKEPQPEANDDNTIVLDPRSFEFFVSIHQQQLESSGVPTHLWRRLHEKCSQQNFDAGNHFFIAAIDYTDCEIDERSSPYAVMVKSEEVDHLHPDSIFLIDHAWTFKPQEALRQLKSSERLRNRVANIVGLAENQSNDTDEIFKRLWRFCHFYTVANLENVEDRLPIWYLNDELGSAIRYSSIPNCRIVPFYYMADQITYSLLFPINKLTEDDEVTIDYAESAKPEEKDAMAYPWVFTDFMDKSFEHKEVGADYFLSGHLDEKLPSKVEVVQKPKPLKVYTEYQYVKNCLNIPEFQFVEDESDADILWYTKHFKRFDTIAEQRKYVNQFPYEFVVTIKDLLAITCRRKNKRVEQFWLPITYNLKTELNEFIAYFETQKQLGQNNHWIVKPFNMARGLDMHITDNLNYIIRLASTGAKIAQKYIENPVLFSRPIVGKVKFDIRYVILLKRVEPLQVYVHKKFFLRFANKAFAMNNFDVYEQHYTVMNYREPTQLLHMKCDDFKVAWHEQYNIKWDVIEKSILDMIKEVFECATMEQPPCGIPDSPYSRALYATDIMLEWNQDSIQPKLLEMNWMPDCQRACEYYPDFYNDIFSLFFLDKENTEVFFKL